MRRRTSKKRRQWLRTVFATLVVTVLVVGVLFILARTAPTSPVSSTPTPTSSDEESIDPAVQLAKDSFIERVVAFEQTLRSRDYRELEYESARHERLAQYMLPEALEAVVQADLSAPPHILKLMRDTKAVKVATVTDTPVADFDSDLVEVETEVNISSEQSGDATVYNDPLTSTTTWVLVEGVWLVSSVDPYE